MTVWTREQLQALPSQSGFRMRGLDMTRLEAFTDAAFAFATTMLVISLSGIPGNIAEFHQALKDIPAFLASFATIASFWYGHWQWSRRFGLKDGFSTLLSLALIFVMLIFIYPLKMTFSALFAWITNGWAYSEFLMTEGPTVLPLLFTIYGLGFCAQTGLISLPVTMPLVAWIFRRKARRLDDSTGTEEELPG